MDWKRIVVCDKCFEKFTDKHWETMSGQASEKIDCYLCEKIIYNGDYCTSMNIIMTQT